MAAEFVDRLNGYTLVVIRRFLGMGATDSRSLPSNISFADLL
jgi:hypothetical protein